MRQEMLEILIGKHIDGEITPSEQQMLEAELRKDSQAMELFEGLKELHESSRAVRNEVIDRGRGADEVFEAAWQQRTKRSMVQVIKANERVRYAAVLAAGLIMGAALQFMMSDIFNTQELETSPGVTARNGGYQKNGEDPALSPLWQERGGKVNRNVDWYSFTDEGGNQWLIEGLREDIVRPAVYYGDL